MKEIKSENPMRWVAFATVICLVFDILQIYDNLAIACGYKTIWGITVKSRGILNPIAPFRILGILVFLYLYVKQSKYAWHVVTILILLNFPAYWTLRTLGIYFLPPRYGLWNDFFSAAAWIFLLVVMLMLYLRYMNFISGEKSKVEIK